MVLLYVLHINRVDIECFSSIFNIWRKCLHFSKKKARAPWKTSVQIFKLICWRVMCCLWVVSGTLINIFKLSYLCLHLHTPKINNNKNNVAIIKFLCEKTNFSFLIYIFITYFSIFIAIKIVSPKQIPFKLFLFTK